MKSRILGIIVLLSSCTPSVDVDDIRQYKCGIQIIKATFLDDNSIILGVNGTNYVLERSAANSGRRYDNANSKVTFIQQGNNTYLTMNGQNYPLCLELEY